MSPSCLPSHVAWAPFTRMVLALLVTHTPCQIDADKGTIVDTETGILNPEAIRSIHQKMDTDGDGRTSLEEIHEFSKAMRLSVARRDIEEIINAMDLDKNGQISLKEILKGVLEWSDDSAAPNTEVETIQFKAADHNGDGELDIEELPGFFYPETDDAVLTAVVAHIIKLRDTDGDGELSPKEFWAQPGEDAILSATKMGDFAKLDTDSSGMLSRELSCCFAGVLGTKKVNRVF